MANLSNFPYILFFTYCSYFNIKSYFIYEAQVTVSPDCTNLLEVTSRPMYSSPMLHNVQCPYVNTYVGPAWMDICLTLKCHTWRLILSLLNAGVA